MVLGICSNILEEMKNFQLDRFRFIVTGFISERAEQGLAYKSYSVTDTSVDDHFTNEFRILPSPASRTGHGPGPSVGYLDPDSTVAQTGRYGSYFREPRGDM